MGWFILAQVFSILIRIVRIGRLSEQEKDLEILILRRQLAILQRKLEKPVKPNQAEKVMLAVLTTRLKEVIRRPAGHLKGIIRIFQPETVIGWHREMVRRSGAVPAKTRVEDPVWCKSVNDNLIFPSATIRNAQSG